MVSHRRLYRVVALTAVVVAASAACKGTEPFVPQATTVLLNATAVTFASLGATQQLTATVFDQRGDTMAGASVTWASNDNAVATVSSTGLVAAAGNGTTQVTGSSGTATSSPATVTVDQAPASLQKVAGDFQTDTVGQPLPIALTVQVNDARGNPIANETVNFAVTQGGGSLTSGSGVTGANGQTSTLWTLGTLAGAVQQATASAATGTATPVTFGATAVAGAAATVVVEAGQGQTAPENTAVPVAPAVRVRDQFNNNRSNATVTFAVTGGGGTVGGGVTTTGTNGVATVGSWTLGPAGPQSLSATVTGTGITGNPITFTADAVVAGAPASVAVSAGNNQTGLVGFALNVPPAVIVRDNASFPVANAEVTFAVATGGGSITGPATVNTGANGIATVGGWVIGGAAGPNTLTATVTGAGITGNPVTFDATGQAAAYTVDVRFRRPVTVPQQAAFDSAKARWERLVYGDLSNIPISLADSTLCAVTPAGSFYVPPINETVDDILIFALLDSIDGPSNILGFATFCFRRVSNDLPVVGLMVFDTADVAGLLSQGLLDETIMHEMGHSIGYNRSVWLLKGLITGAGGADPHFTGSEGIAAFDRNGGSGYVAGAKVPLENTGGPGTRDGHWRESVFATELMTGFINPGVLNPLSVISTASMGDVGYTVNYAASDPYTVANPLALRVAPGTLIDLKEPLPRHPVIVLDDNGRVVRVEPPQ